MDSRQQSDFVSRYPTVIREFLALGSGEALSRIIAFCVTMYLARTLGASAYGVIALAAGVNLYLAKIADFGIEAAGVREVAGAPQSIGRMAPAVLGLRLLIAAVVAAVAGFTCHEFLPRPDGTVLALYCLTLLPIAASTKWIHIGLERARTVAAARVAGETLVLGLVVSLVGGAGDLTRVPLLQLTGECLVSAALIFALLRRGYGAGLRWRPREAWPLFARGFPLVVQMLLGLLIFNSDLIFLRALWNSTTVGYYAAAYALIAFTANIGIAFGTSLLPSFTRAGAGTAEESSLWRTAIAQVVAVTLPLAAGACMVSGGVIELGFGPAYAPSAAILAILAWSIPVSILRNVPWFALVARGRGHRLIMLTAWGVLLNLVLNSLLVAPLGATGAAAATVATETFCFVSMARVARSEGFPGLPWRRLWRPVVATGAMVPVIGIAGGSGVVVTVMLGAAVYASVLAVIGGLGFGPNGMPGLKV
ncbi:MAG: hypothetical protein D6815_10655 [Candidatus Dadabacteria bacterium]|nr:MAG: hypothetical protein D6815_10655 [Candidatus Dadabacteria bacterium]